MVKNSPHTSKRELHQIDYCQTPYSKKLDCFSPTLENVLIFYINFAERFLKLKHLNVFWSQNLLDNKCITE